MTFFIFAIYQWSKWHSLGLSSRSRTRETSENRKRFKFSLDLKVLKKYQGGKNMFTLIILRIPAPRTNEANPNLMTCHGHQVDKSPWQVFLEDVEGPSKISCIPARTPVLPGIDLPWKEDNVVAHRCTKFCHLDLEI